MLTCIAVTLVLLSFAAVLTRHARFLLLQFRMDVPTAFGTRFERAEKLSRIFAHLIWFLSLTPPAAFLTLEMVRPAQLLPRLVGTAVAAGLMVTVLKQMADFKIKPLFVRDLSIGNETGLAVLGAIGSALLATVWTMLSQPELRQELLKAISGSK